MLGTVFAGGLFHRPIIDGGGVISFALTHYTGNGTSQDVVTGQNFSSGEGMLLVFGATTATSRGAYDTLRGTTAASSTNNANPEYDYPTGVTAFNADGISVGAGVYNTNTEENLALSWLTETGFFDVVTYTGDGTVDRDIAHTLGAVPTMIWIKRRTSSVDWQVYHGAFTPPEVINLNTTDGKYSGAGRFIAAPDAAGFNVGNNTTVNANAADYVAYLFADKAGVSKMGSYAGTGATGNVISGLGFEPKAVLQKRADTNGDGWVLFYKNAAGVMQFTQLQTAVASSAGGSFLQFDADGFTQLSSEGAFNASGGSYIYAAWA